MLKIQIFGPGCIRCNTTYNLVKAVLEETQTEATLEKVSDLVQMATMGILSTPAIAINGKVVMSGRVPSSNEVAALLKKE